MILPLASSVKGKTCLQRVCIPKNKPPKSKFGTKPNSYTHFNNKSVIVNQLPQCQKYEIQLEMQAIDLCWGGRVGRKEGQSETFMFGTPKHSKSHGRWFIETIYSIDYPSKKKWSLCGTSTMESL